MAEAESLSAVWEMSNRPGQAVLGERLSAQEAKDASESIACPRGERASDERRGEGITITQQGEVSYGRANKALADARHYFATHRTPLR